jgi:hypothetical protein
VVTVASGSQSVVSALKLSETTTRPGAAGTSTSHPGKESALPSDAERKAHSVAARSFFGLYS